MRSKSPLGLTTLLAIALNLSIVAFVGAIYASTLAPLA